MSQESANTFQTLNGLFKETYAPNLKNLIPDQVKLMNMIKFMEKAKQPGNFYHQAVILGAEHGITFAGSDEDAFNLEAPVSGVVKDAVVRGNPVLMRSLLGYTAASRAAQGGAQSFMDATKYLVANMLRSMAKKLEIQMLYGQSSYGAISAVSGAELTIKTSEWAPGIWAGSEGMPVEIRSYEAVGASPDSSTSRGFAVVKSVDLGTRKVTLQSAVGGVIVTASQEDVIFHKGAFGKEFPGIHKILTQTTGSLFGINIGEYSLFRGNQYSAASAALSFKKVNLALTRPIEKGLEGKILALVSHKSWADMMNDLADLRSYDQSYSSAQVDQGSQKIRFFSQTGEVEIMPSTYVKEGYAYLLSIEDWSRIGSSDMSFKRPGQGDEYFRDLENSAAYELRLFSDFSVLCSAPGRNTVITGIVNS